MILIKALEGLGIKVTKKKITFSRPIEAPNFGGSKPSKPVHIEPAPTGTSARSAENADRINQLISLLEEQGVVKAKP